jgi:hypothetical protein
MTWHYLMEWIQPGPNAEQAHVRMVDELRHPRTKATLSPLIERHRERSPWTRAPRLVASGAFTTTTRNISTITQRNRTSAISDTTFIRATL